jgi:hypothetical protein
MIATYRKYRTAVVGLATIGEDGHESIGTAFHIGDGFLVTARHVVENRRISDVVVTPSGSLTRIYSVRYPSDEAVDLALLSTDFDLSYYLDRVRYAHPEDWPKGEAIEIGGHLDDWIGDELVLTPLLMLGFPPVPTSSAPVMLAVSGEVNAALDRYTTPHVHFVISSAARGGFSGGPVIFRGGTLLGVVTQSLVREVELGEPGFAVALSVEPLLNLLFEHEVLPRANRLVCYLYSSSDQELAMFDTLLSSAERAAFDKWKVNLTTEDEPTELGVPTAPIVDGEPLWEAEENELQHTRFDGLDIS